jgi:hypothetical protein
MPRPLVTVSETVLLAVEALTRPLCCWFWDDLSLIPRRTDLHEPVIAGNSTKDAEEIGGVLLQGQRAVEELLGGHGEVRGGESRSDRSPFDSVVLPKKEICH